MKDVDYHSWLLSCLCKTIYADEKKFDNKWIHMSDWLLLASGISNIDISTTKFDSSVIWDSGVMEYEDLRSEILTQLTKELTIFNYIWGSLETLIDDNISKEAINTFGKINATTGWLKKNYKYKPVNGYIELVDELKKLLIETNYCKDKLDFKYIYKKYCYKSHVNLIGFGLFLVYKIRNKFAHGATEMPYVNDDIYENNDIDKYIHDLKERKIIELSSKITLLSIQMILKLQFKENNFIIEELYLNKDFKLEKMDIENVLDNIHIANF